MFVNSASALALSINSANASFFNFPNNTKLSQIKDGAIVTPSSGVSLVQQGQNGRRKVGGGALRPANVNE